MSALEWLLEWQEKQRNKENAYFIPRDNVSRGAKPLVEALKQRNLWPWGQVRRSVFVFDFVKATFIGKNIGLQNLRRRMNLEP